MQTPIRAVHTIDPVWDAHSRILILGSFPSAASRTAGFYYAHPQNRFWKVLSALCGEPLPVCDNEKKALLLRHGIALWDCAAECIVTGSSDASIRSVRPNDLTPLLRESRIEKVFCNGALADRLYRTYLEPETGIPAVRLPSTSPANAAWSEARLEAAWRCILDMQIP